MEPTNLILALSQMNGIQAIMTLILFLTITYLPFIIKFIVKIVKNKPFFKDDYGGIKYLIEKSIERAIKIYEINKYEILSEQMNIVHRTTDRVKYILLRDFIKLNCRSRDIRAYEKILFYTLSEINTFLRKWVKDNHLLDKSDKEYDAYIKEITETLINTHTFLLDKEYVSEDFQVCRKDLKEHNMKYSVPEIRGIIEGMMRDVREVCKNKEREKDEINKKFEEDVSE